MSSGGGFKMISELCLGREGEGEEREGRKGGLGRELRIKISRF